MEKKLKIIIGTIIIIATIVAIVSIGLYTFLKPTITLNKEDLEQEEILLKERADIIKHEIYNEGLKLIVSLNSNKLKKGDILIINATLLNINNTSNITYITFAAGYGEIRISIFDKNDIIVYGEVMIAPGPTAPFPLFKPGEKISHVLKWDTSMNILNGSTSPSIGKYYLEIEAYVTNQETESKIILKIERIEVELL